MLMQHVPRRHARRGFTLMELLVVMAILLVLAGASILAYKGIFAESKISVAKSTCVQLKGQLENFSMMPSQGGNYPDPANGFQELVDRGLMTRIPVDPWGMPYQWNLMPLADGLNVQAVVWSCGPNRLDEQGGGDDVTSE